MNAPAADLSNLKANILTSVAAINQEVTHAYLHRKVYTEVRDEIIARHPQADGTFINSYSALYARAQIMAIRRITDKSKETDSLWQVIQRLRNNPKLASRSAVIDAVREQHPDDEQLLRDVDHYFTTQYGDGEVVADKVLAEMQTRLRSTVAEVIQFADRSVAHRDPRGAVLSVTYKEIHDGLDHVAGILKEVNMLLRFTHNAHQLLVIQGDWRDVFRPGLFPTPPLPGAPGLGPSPTQP